MLTRIRNATAARKNELVLPYSKFKSNLAKLLQKEGFVSGVNELTGRHNCCRLILSIQQMANR